MLGKLLFVGLKTNNKNIIKRLIKECHIGGVILYSQNYRSYDDMIDFINYIHSLAQEAGYIILIGIDQEGYRVNRLPHEIHNLKSPYAFHTNTQDLIKHSEIISSFLKENHINVNFAPVLDIKRFDLDHSIGDRCFGDDAKTVIKNTLPYIEEMRKNNIISVIKHFPGHGATKIDSHILLPIIFKNKRLKEEDILPFKRAIDQGIDALMVGHFIIFKLSSFIPTSLSSKTVIYLREKLNFSKIIITDDLQMGILKLINKAKLIKLALNNGFNMIIIKYYDNFFKDYYKLQKYQKQNKLNLNKINYSLQLREDLITKYNITNNLITNKTDITHLNKQIDELNLKAK